MNLFTIDSIYIYSECEERIRKTIKPGVFSFKGGLGDGFFGKGVNVCAIVGVNGSGKSSLLEIVYRMINNLGAVMLKDYQFASAENLRYVSGIYADLYYSIGDGKGKLSVRNSQIGLSFNEETWFFKTIKEETHRDFEGYRFYETVANEQIKEISDHFFYTIVANYSIQSYVAHDYKGEGLKMFSEQGWVDDTFHNWIDSLFHKNDGYLCPINLNPYRENGKVDMVREERLTNDRLQSILVYFKKRGYHYLSNYELEDVHFKFYWDKIISIFPDRNSRNNPNGGKLTKENHKNKYARLINEFKRSYNIPNSVANIVLNNFRINAPVSDDNIFWAARLYMVAKVLLIAQKYPSYSSYAHLGDSMKCFQVEVSNEEKRELKSLGKQIREDKSHITNKLNRVWHFITKADSIDHIRGIYQNFTYEKYEHWMKEEDKLCSISELMNNMPPSFFLPEVIFTKTNEDGTKVRCPMRHMSSGERQFLHSTSATVYHLLNLRSIRGDKRPSYKSINVIMDEVEICYHPEYQRTYVARFTDLVKQLLLASGSSINIILTTHSPFILSDIPKCNILYLEEGAVANEKDDIINPFGANVNDILKQSFFLKNGFVGEFAKRKINGLVKFLVSEHPKDRTIDLNIAQDMIDLIGEPLIKDNLQALLDEFINNHPQYSTPKLVQNRQRRISELKEELQRLEGI